MTRLALHMRMLFALLLATLVLSLTPFVGGAQVGLAYDYRPTWFPRINIVRPHDGQGNPTGVDKSRGQDSVRGGSRHLPRQR